MPLCRSPLTLRLRYSRVRGRRQSKFLASSSTGGARNFYPKGGINAPPEAFGFLLSTASPMGSRAVFQYPSDARPPEALRASRGYDFDSAAKGAHSARRLSRDWRGGSRSVSLGEHRGAKNALHRLCAKFRIPNSALLCATPLSKCARTARTPSFFMHPKGALHTALLCFIRRRRASFEATLSPHGTHLYPKPHTVCR